ncbi:MAG: hypothetical protein MK013_00490 [Dehalococcoidia bacterium]|jgi:hypothetical protein|nr:hypothetical protein [Chloroflexota bacterium]MAR57436.1 hypothetical protein [Rickettsiales bacterium]MBD33055.1 hypothetical protein [Dehalococcoidia bacterium]MQF83892.1 hypothetical protein [SAR202 cluster bacterium]MAQ49194.1 hypothetical protein [Chloroflexota bacterium]|tara:strand:- start:1154 stop:1345 length:192 start_codon:yes stop_codon:yes gene_type:complete
MKKNFKVIEDKNKVIDPWEDYINKGYDNLNNFQKIIRLSIIFSIILIIFIFIIGYLLVKTGQW